VARFQHIIWDWNGTLLDDIHVVVDVMNSLLTRRAMPELTPDSYREVFQFPVRAYYEAVGFDFAREPFEALAEEWIAAFEANWRRARLHAGALETIMALRSRGIGQSVLSAAERTVLHDQAAHFGVTPHVDRLVGIDNHHAESKLEHGRRWLNELAVDPIEVLLVGDTTHDFEVGQELGVPVVLIDDGHQSRQRLEACGVPVLDSLAELVSLNGPLDR
jgi:phosphoglycolate phosphatase